MFNNNIKILFVSFVRRIELQNFLFISIFIAGEVDEIIFEAQTLKLTEIGEYTEHIHFINGLPNYSCSVSEHLKVQDSKMIRLRSLDGQNLQEVEFYHFPPGSAIALRYPALHFFDLL